MASPRLSKLELEIMDVLWGRGASSIREVQERLPDDRELAYSTVQTMVYRLEAKGAVRRTRKIGNAHIFEATVSRGTAQGRLLEEFLGVFGGMRPVMAHLIETGKLTLEDIQEAERALHELEKNRKRPRKG